MRQCQAIPLKGSLYARTHILTGSARRYKESKGDEGVYNRTLQTLSYFVSNYSSAARCGRLTLFPILRARLYFVRIAEEFVVQIGALTQVHTLGPAVDSMVEMHAGSVSTLATGWWT